MHLALGDDIDLALAEQTAVEPTTSSAKEFYGELFTGNDALASVPLNLKASELPKFGAFLISNINGPH